MPSDLVPIHYQSFFKFENVHMWSLQRPSRSSRLVTCKTKRGLTCIGFGSNVTPDFSYQQKSSVLRPVAKRPLNLMIDENSDIPEKRISFKNFCK